MGVVAVTIAQFMGGAPNFDVVETLRHAWPNTSARRPSPSGAIGICLLVFVPYAVVFDGDAFP